eukprot:2621428-Heterocapsa_arctica.AAC.1
MPSFLPELASRGRPPQVEEPVVVGLPAEHGPFELHCTFGDPVEPPFLAGHVSRVVRPRRPRVEVLLRGFVPPLLISLRE